jgi:hypothetical protein
MNKKIEKNKLKITILIVLKNCDEKIKNEEKERLEKEIKKLLNINSVLDKRQKAYKVSQ